jgi:PPOX class probable F420-dependent enzyme
VASGEEQAFLEKRLGEEIVIWLTTVRPDGQPQSSPVWFVWDGERFLIYSRPGSGKIPNIRGNPRVSLNLDSDGEGGEIVTIEGTAEIDPDAPPANQVDAYVAKYLEHIRRLGTEPVPFAGTYSAALRITPTRRRVYS